MDLLPKILIISLIAGVFTQAVKIIFKSIKAKKFKFSTLDDYGGMPSSHASFLTALLTAIGLQEGIFTTSFAVSFVIAAILIRDAVGIRMELEKQGKLIKQIVKKQNLDKDKQIFVDGKIGDRIGHTYPEIFVGGIIGIVLAFIFHNIL